MPKPILACTTAFPRNRPRFALGALLLASASAAHAQQAMDRATQLDRIVVTARLEQVPAFDLPASLDTAMLGDDEDADVDVSDHLHGIPGVQARDRQNYAQDMQLSIRGYGARATFGVRGIRLYADGIPATMPDGQGQLSHFNLPGGGRIEVMRGPFSALYGNSSGGVVQSWSAPPTPTPESTLQSTLGRDDSRTLGGRLRGSAGAMGYNIAVQRFQTDGYRAHSAAERTSGNAKLGFDLKRAGTLDVVANTFDSRAQDPLGLTREQANDDPRQATAAAGAFDTRKSIEQHQLGALYTLPFGDGQKLRAMAYAGRREVTQFLSVPQAAQADPLNAGGVIDLDGDYSGADLRWSWRGEMGGKPLEFTIGTSVDRQFQHRRGYENFVAATLGVRGALRRDEEDDVSNFDQYVQAWWRFAPRWSLLAGVRHSEVRFRADDHYVTASNPDDSGSKRYARSMPVAGLVFAASDDWRYYLSAGGGFETPTFNELGYRADGGSGLAFDLKPAISRDFETGAKWRNRAGAHLELALFRADTEDELGVARNVAGRSSYRNEARARRQGMELGAGIPLGDRWNLDAAFTWLDATFRDGFPVCTGNGCTDPSTLVAAGTRLPGTARKQLDVALDWRDGDWNAGIEGTGVGDVPVNDQGSERAPGYFVVDAHAGHRWRIGRSELLAFVRIDNLLDRAYIGSVIVNEGNGRYYEPAPGRGFLLGARWRWGGD